MPVEEDEVDALELERPQHAGRPRPPVPDRVLDGRRGEVGEPLGLVAQLGLGGGPGPEPVEHERAQPGEDQGGDDGAEDGDGDAARAR